MKYRIEREKAFIPFSVKLTFETRDEYLRFHDEIMPQITGVEFHNFHRDIYKAGEGCIDFAEDEIISE